MEGLLIRILDKFLNKKFVKINSYIDVCKKNLKKLFFCLLFFFFAIESNYEIYFSRDESSVIDDPFLGKQIS
jgi:hypothetical protein